MVKQKIDFKVIHKDFTVPLKTKTLNHQIFIDILQLIVEFKISHWDRYHQRVIEKGLTKEQIITNKRVKVFSQTIKKHWLDVV